jgi:hypothetical protein
MWFVVTRLTAKHIGVLISPDDARDAAATTCAIVAPDQIGMAHDLLSHRDVRTTGRHSGRGAGFGRGPNRVGDRRHHLNRVASVAGPIRSIQ